MKDIKLQPKSIFYSFISILCLCFILLVVMSVYTGICVETTERPEHLGNFSDNISFVTSSVKPDEFTFMVIGDVKDGTATFEELLDEARADKPAFAVILGDFVSHYSLASHRLFALEMAEEKLPFPIFLIPGNHEIHPKGPFTLKDFEQQWGPAQFHFNIGNNLFIFLNNAPPYDKSEEYLTYLEQVLSHHPDENQEIFVFMHVPPQNLNSWIDASPLYGSDKLFQLARKYGIRYIFTGEHHGYIKTIKDGTTYIVTGGGGAKLRGEHGRFHHMTRIAIQHGNINETVIATNKRLETFELLERNIVTHLWPLITKNPIHIVMTILLFGIAIRLLFSTIRRGKRYSSSQKHQEVDDSCPRLSVILSNSKP